MGTLAMTEKTQLLRVAATSRLSVSQVAHIATARVYNQVGWPGIAGLILAAAAITLLSWLAYAGNPDPDNSAHGMSAEPLARAPVIAPVRITPPALSHSSESVLVLKRIKASIQTLGLIWPQAEYRITPLGDEGLATLDIRTTVKGSYPKVRKLIATLLENEPALGLRELTLSRPNGDTADIEAKIRWVVFLADGWAPAESGRRP
jgi:hypothetical protein